MKELTQLKSKHELVENILNEAIKKIDAISRKGVTKNLTNGYKILNKAKYFSSGTLQYHLIYFSYKKYLKFFINSSKVLSWKSIRFSEESIEYNYIRKWFCSYFK